MATLSRWGQSSGRLVRYAVGVVLVVTVGLSTLAVGALYQVRPLLRTAGADSLAHTRRQWNTTWQTLGTLPESLSGIDETLAASAGYLRRCTRPTDRVFIGDNLPEVQYFASRRFAAGQFGYFSNFYTSPAWQQQAIARWRQQSVPIALTQSGRRFTEEFGSDYPLLTQYLQSRYRRAGSLVVERGASMTVWVDSAVRMTTDRVTGLPCRLPG